jgi:hypothetical protein
MGMINIKNENRQDAKNAKVIFSVFYLRSNVLVTYPLGVLGGLIDLHDR